VEGSCKKMLFLG